MNVVIQDNSRKLTKRPELDLDICALSSNFEFAKAISDLFYGGSEGVRWVRHSDGVGSVAVGARTVLFVDVDTVDRLGELVDALVALRRNSFVATVLVSDTFKCDDFSNERSAIADVSLMWPMTHFRTHAAAREAQSKYLRAVRATQAAPDGHVAA